jgi:hypothetical protein
MPSIFVRLRAEAMDGLIDQARAQRRHPREQAALIIERAIAKAAVPRLPPPEHETKRAEAAP